MQRVEQGEYEALSDLGDFGDCDGAFVELPIVYVYREYVVYELLYVLRGCFGEGAAGGFDGVGEQDDGTFLELGFWAVVAVGGLLYLVWVV